MTTTQLIAAVATKSGISKTLAKNVIETLNDVIIADVKAGNKVSMFGFGTFQKKSGTRKFNLPTFQGTKTVTRVSFKASSVFKKAL